MNTVTVSQINEYIKRKLDDDYLLKSIAVSGEISNYVAHSSGHSYFSLKDKGGVLKAVMFKGSKAGLSFKPENGMMVVAMGSLSSYPRDGVYQLYVSKLVSDGTGDLFAAFEELKKRLGEEGLFDDELKRPLPEFPNRVGVITSETGAVLHDIQNVMSRRWSLTEIVLYPAKVQGEGGAESVIAALERLNDENICDVAIIARGGGSIEDLWEFNDERLARAVRASVVPVISAVGHETDFTICDFAADLRAPTPSAAAELAVPSADEVRQRLDSIEEALNGAMKGLLFGKKLQLRLLAERLNRGAEGTVSRSRLNIIQSEAKIKNSIRLFIMKKKHQLIDSAGRLEKNNPSAILGKGYGFVTRDGKSVKSVSEFDIGDRITVFMRDGSISADITEVNENEF